MSGKPTYRRYRENLFATPPTRSKRDETRRHSAEVGILGRSEERAVREH